MTHVHVYRLCQLCQCLVCLATGGGGHELKGQKGTGGGRMGYGVQEVGGCDHPVPPPTINEKEHTGSSNVMSTLSY